MLRAVVALDTLVRQQDIARDRKVVRRRVERLEVGAEDHDAEVDLQICCLVRLLHALLELIGQVLRQVHVYKFQNCQKISNNACIEQAGVSEPTTKGKAALTQMRPDRIITAHRRK